DEGVLRAVDPPGRAAQVHGLAGVLLDVRPLDPDADRPGPAAVAADVVGDLDVEPAVDGDRLVVLADLVVLRHVRIEVVLPREPRPRRDPAAAREPDAYRGLHGDLVRDRQRTGEPEAGRAHLRVGRGAEVG